MSYDAAKVNWKPEEHEAAKSADQIYETLRPALSNGVGTDDISAAIAVAKPSYEVWKYLVANSKNKLVFAQKLIELGLMLARDNDLTASKQ